MEDTQRTRHRSRSISPVGTSRFEQPFDPPPSITGARSNPNSTAASPTSAYSPATFFTPSMGHDHFSPSSRRAAASTFSSSSDTMDTAPTSVSSGDNNHSPKPDGLSPEDWFARFHSDDDLSIVMTDECPNREALAAARDIPIFDAEGTSIPFGSIYDPATATHQRQLVIFVRHFYCGACQAYLQVLTQGISMREYFSIPVPTSIIIIGCGQPHLIPHYKAFTNCPFPIFADPTRNLFKSLGMTATLNIGSSRPDYMKDISPAAWAAGQFKTVNASLKDPDGIRKRDILRGGHLLQVGGEFLFEDGQVVWCHRMKNMRNHAEVSVIRKLLEMDE